MPTSIPDTRVAPAGEAIARAAALLAGASRPIAIVGDGIAFSGAQAELARVAELLGAAVWGANFSEVNMAAEHPLFRGQLGHMFGEHSRAITAEADAVLICGTYVFPEVFPALEGVFAPGAKVVHIDLDAYEIAKNFPVDLGLVADPKLTLGLLADELARTLSRGAAAPRPTRRTQRPRRAEGARARRAAAARDREFDGDTPMHPSTFMAELAEPGAGRRRRLRRGADLLAGADPLPAAERCRATTSRPAAARSASASPARSASSSRCRTRP